LKKKRNGQRKRESLRSLLVSGDISRGGGGGGGYNLFIK